MIMAFCSKTPARRTNQNCKEQNKEKLKVQLSIKKKCHIFYFQSFPSNKYLLLSKPARQLISPFIIIILIIILKKKKNYYHYYSNFVLYFEQKLVLVSFGSGRRSYSGAVWSEKCFANHFSPNLKQNRGECGVTLPSGSKISGPQQSLLTEADIFIVERWENVWPTLLFLTQCIMQRKVIHVGLNFFLPYLQDQDGLSRNRNFATVTSLFERLAMS